MNSDKHQQEAEQALRKQYRAISTEVPASELDEQILAAARNSVAAKHTVLSIANWRRWSTPLASAAVLLLGVTFILNSNLVGRWEQQSQPTLSSPVTEPAPAPKAAQSAAIQDDGSITSSADALSESRSTSLESRSTSLKVQQAASENISKAQLNSSTDAEFASLQEKESVSDFAGSKLAAKAKEKKKSTGVATPGDTPVRTESTALPRQSSSSELVETEDRAKTGKPVNTSTDSTEHFIRLQRELETAERQLEARKELSDDKQKIGSTAKSVAAAKSRPTTPKQTATPIGSVAKSTTEKTTATDTAKDSPGKKSLFLDQAREFSSIAEAKAPTDTVSDETPAHGGALEEIMVTAQRRQSRTLPSEPRIAALNGIAGRSADSETREKKMLVVTESAALEKLLRARYNEWYFIAVDAEWLTLRRQFNQRRYKISTQLLAKPLPHWSRGQMIESSDIPLAKDTDSE